jgi:hypothetical protein
VRRVLVVVADMVLEVVHEKYSSGVRTSAHPVS